MIRTGLPRLLICAVLATLLPGCVAALVPVMAGGIVAREELRRDGPAVDATNGPSAQTTPTATAQAAMASKAKTDEIWTVSAATALPPPAAAPVSPAGPASDTQPAALPQGDPADPYGAFARFALAAALRDPSGAGGRQSALLDQSTLTEIAPALARCGKQQPAVMVDLDPGEQPFNPDDPPLPAAGLADHLASLRAAGITVAWISGLPAESAEKLYTILQATGLDPDRTDRLLLLSPSLSRKQLRRDAAGRDWCVLAVAGDKRGDFDEVFDYLRDPEGTLARALEPNIGAGWFLAPPPID